MLKIKNLSVKVAGKNILKKVNLAIEKGEIHALLGPNASGKSTLVHTIVGFPKYEVTKGDIYFGGKEITKLSIEERAKLGIALAFQHPPIVRGVTLSKLLEKTAKRGIKPKEFFVNPNLLEREINLDFSGGERKLSEILQVISLNPKFVILDELDSGLDFKNLGKLTSIVKEKLLKNSVSLLLISHHGEIFHFLKPDFVHVMLEGEIVNTSKDIEMVWRTIKEHGYEKCRKCPFLTS